MKKIGRPKGINNMESICTIRLDNFTAQRLEAYCQLARRQKSDVIREAINLFFENNGNIKEKTE